jgi:ABC-type Fe3+-siderophore transport system permease subunit
MGEYVFLGGLFLLFISILLIYFASDLNHGIKRNIFLISAGLNSIVLFILIFFQLFTEGLNAGECILFIYNVSIFSGLVINFITNSGKEKIYRTPVYQLNTNFNFKKSGLAK